MESVSAIRIFTRVVDSGSFSEAGRQLGIAPSSVSRQISDLEYELGARLFHRTTRRLSLTEAGQLYYEHSARILIEFDEAKLAVSQMDGAPTGILRVTVPTGIGRYLISSALPIFLTRYPAVKVVVSMTDQMVDIVEAGIDLAIRVGIQRDSSLIARKVGSSRRFVAASPEYLGTSGTPEKPSDLESLNCLTFRAHPGKNLWRFEGSQGAADVRVSGSFFSTSADALVAAAGAGIGLILLPDWNIGTESAQGRLVEVLSGYRAIPETSPIYAVYPHQRYLPPKVRAFVDFLVDHFSRTASGKGRRRKSQTKVSGRRRKQPSTS